MHLLVFASPQAGSTLKLFEADVENPIFSLAGPPTEGGGTIGTNVIGPRFEAYLETLAPEDPITFSLSQMRSDDVEEAQRVAATYGRHVVVLQTY